MTAQQWSILGGLAVAALGGMGTAIASGNVQLGEWGQTGVLLTTLLAGVIALLTPKVTTKPPEG